MGRHFVMSVRPLQPTALTEKGRCLFTKSKAMFSQKILQGLACVAVDFSAAELLSEPSSLPGIVSVRQRQVDILCKQTLPQKFRMSTESQTPIKTEPKSGDDPSSAEYETILAFLRKRGLRGTEELLRNELRGHSAATAPTNAASAATGKILY